MKNRKIGSLILTQIALSLLASAAFAADQDAGRVLFVAGDATIISPNGQERIARKGEMLGQGDRLVTSVKGMIQVKMPDRGMVAVRPNTDLKMDKVIMPTNGTGVISQGMLLNSGGVRVITGDAQDKKGFLISTPTGGRIGLREGDGEALVIPHKVVVGGREVAPPVPEGTYNRVNAGAGVMTSVAGSSITLAPNQVSFTPPKQDATPIFISSLPQSYTSLPVPLARASVAPATDRLAAPSTELVAGKPLVAGITAVPPTASRTTLAGPVLNTSGLTRPSTTTTEMPAPTTAIKPPTTLALIRTPAPVAVMAPPTTIAVARLPTPVAVMPPPVTVMAPPKPVMVMPPLIVKPPVPVPAIVQPTLTRTTTGGTTTTTLKVISPTTTTTTISRCLVGVTC